MSVIVDTCVWSRFLRRDRDKQDPIVRELERLVREDAVQMLGPIRQELLSGSQPQDKFGQLRDFLRFFPNLSLDEDLALRRGKGGRLALYRGAAAREGGTDGLGFVVYGIRRKTQELKASVLSVRQKRWSCFQSGRSSWDLGDAERRHR